MDLKASAKENGCARVFAANPPRVRRATRAGRCHRHPCKREARHALYPLFSMAVCQTLFDIVMAAMRERCDERSKTFVVAQALPFGVRVAEATECEGRRFMDRGNAYCARIHGYKSRLVWASTGFGKHVDRSLPHLGYRETPADCTHETSAASQLRRYFVSLCGHH
jgi:hypothetical protein